MSRDGAVTVETFLLDFTGDLYDQQVRLEFCQKLRDEQKFPSLSALQRQIQLDIGAARRYFAQ